MTGERPSLDGIVEALRDMHAWRGWVWGTGTDPFEMAASAILVQNTAWTNAERALANLRQADALNHDAIARLDDATLEALIRPSGQFRQKARKLREFVALIDRHGSFASLLTLPRDQLRAELLATWGIGPETADAIVLYCARQPAFVIDAYTMRVFGRLGFSAGPGSYGDWQRFFEDRLPHDPAAWAEWHSLIVLHAKHLCLKRRPKCADCSLAPRCLFAQEHADDPRTAPPSR